MSLGFISITDPAHQRYSRQEGIGYLSMDIDEYNRTLRKVETAQTSSQNKF